LAGQSLALFPTGSRIVVAPAQSVARRINNPVAKITQIVIIQIFSGHSLCDKYNRQARVWCYSARRVKTGLKSINIAISIAVAGQTR
jgi:hypothetical protein